MPLTWSQVRKNLDPKRFTIHTAPGLLKKSKAWEDYCEVGAVAAIRDQGAASAMIADAGAGTKPRVRRPAKRKTKAKPRARSLSPNGLEGAVKAPLPEFVEPCLATLVAAPPTGDEWVHEIKFDGYRIQARIDGDGVKMITRGGLDWTKRFGDLPAALRKIHRGKALIDCELVVEDAVGHSSFSELAATLKSGRSDRFVLQCFDLLHLDGFNLMPAPLIARKELLLQLLGDGKPSADFPIRYSAHLSGRRRAHADGSLPPRA